MNATSNESTVQFNGGDMVKVVSSNVGPRTPMTYAGPSDMLGKVYMVELVDRSDSTVRLATPETGTGFRWVAMASVTPVVAEVPVSDEVAQHEAAVETGMAHGPLTAQESRMRDLEARIDTMSERLAEAVNARTRAEDALAEFKESVAKVASVYAVKHGWCSVVDEALGEVGLERVPTRRRVVMDFTYRVEVDVENADDDDTAVRWVQESVKATDFDSSDSDLSIIDWSEHDANLWSVSSSED